MPIGISYALRGRTQLNATFQLRSGCSDFQRLRPNGLSAFLPVGAALQPTQCETPWLGIRVSSRIKSGARIATAACDA